MADVRSLLGIRHPIVLAGMGGVAGPDLTAAVSRAGAAGCLGGYRLDGPQLSDAIGQVVAGTTGTFGVNVIPEVAGGRLLSEQLDVIDRVAPDSTFVSVFGPPDDRAIDALRATGRPVLTQVGTVDDALAAAEFSDAVIVQGTEAGGHLLGSLCLDDLLADCLRADVPAPLIATGGIATASRIGALMDRGAAGVQLGTVFIAAQESAAHDDFVDEVIGAGPDDTAVTDRYAIGWPGRRHRVVATPTAVGPVLRSTFIGRTRVADRTFLVPRYGAAVPTLTTTGRVREMALYCGTSCAEVRVRESADQILTRLTGSTR